MQKITISQIAEAISKLSRELEANAHQAVANRRKFLFACYQFQQFSNKFNNHADATLATSTQIRAYNSILLIAKKYNELFSQNMPQVWGMFALDKSNTELPSELCQMANDLYHIGLILDPEAANSFDAESEQWLQFHILDLHATASSLSQYKMKPNDPTSEVIEKRLNSINAFLKKYQGKVNPHITTKETVSLIPVNCQGWRVSLDYFEIIKKAGSGVSATVYYATDKRDGKKVAIKQLKFKSLRGSKLQTFQRELAILASVDHPSLLRFVGATDTVPYSIITEWMPNDSLYHNLHKHHRLNPTMRTIALFDIARGMKYLHSRQIIHRDLKTLNVLLDENLLIRICDFGFSRKADKTKIMTKNVGTPHWMAPELLSSNNGYDNKVDVYSYAIVCWECVTCALPYPDLDSTQIIAKVLVDDLRPELPPNLPQSLKALITDCWERDPKLRPTFGQIVRRFKSGEILIDGANKDEVMKYMKSVNDIDDDVEEDIFTEDKLPKIGENGKISNKDLEEFVKSIKTLKIPHHLLQQCWDIVQNIDINTQTDLYRRSVSVFIQTPFIGKAAKALRELPHSSITPQIITEVVNAIPTGNEETDRNLIICACKNGFYVEAALHAMHPDDLKISLEISAQNAIPPEKLDSLAELCIQCLSSQDPMLVVASLRCLISTSQCKKLSVDTLKSIIQSKNRTLQLVSYMAIAEMAKEGVVLPSDLIDLFIVKWAEEVASIVLITACENLENAQYLIDYIASNNNITSKTVTIKILYASLKFKELHQQIKYIIETQDSLLAEDSKQSKLTEIISVVCR